MSADAIVFLIDASNRERFDEAKHELYVRTAKYLPCDGDIHYIRIIQSRLKYKTAKALCVQCRDVQMRYVLSVLDATYHCQRAGQRQRSVARVLNHVESWFCDENDSLLS